MSIEVRQVSKSFGGFAALREVSLKVEPGELVALLGPSGSGKTTLLRIIAGLDSADEMPGGPRVMVGGPRVGFVFQHYALFRHMTVFENIAFGLRVRPRATRPAEARIRARVLELLKLIQLDGLAGRYPSQLSGGQRQRVALARALAIEPEVLLLDEPFGALDAKVRQGLRRWLRKLHDEIGMTTILVTHDQDEALEVADRIVVMNKGRIEQVGTPEDVFHRPVNEFVMDFLGRVNLFHARADEGGERRVFVRPHDMEIGHEAQTGASLGAVVRRIHAAGPMVKVELESVSGEPLQVEIAHERYRALGLKVGARVYVSPGESKVFFEDYSI